MAADPWGVCVVPAAGDPGGLLATRRLADIPRGSTLQWSSMCSGRAPELTGDGPGSPCWPSALPLRWGEALVPEGWDRARRVLHSHAPSWPRTLEMLPDMETLRFVAWALTVAGLASRVVLLDLVDGRVVERAP